MTRSTDPDALLKALRRAPSKSSWDMADEIERRRAAEKGAPAPEARPPEEPPAVDLEGLKRSWTALLVRGREVSGRAKGGDAAAVAELAVLRETARTLRGSLREALGREMTDEEEARGFAA